MAILTGIKIPSGGRAGAGKLTVLDLIENVILRFSLDLSEVAVLLQGLGLGLSPGHGFEATQVVVTAVDGGPAGYLPLALGRL